MNKKLFEITAKGLAPQDATRLVGTICRLLKISQNRLCSETGVAMSTICRWKKGTHKPSLEAVNALRTYAIKRGLQ